MELPIHSQVTIELAVVVSWSHTQRSSSPANLRNMTGDGGGLAPLPSPSTSWLAVAWYRASACGSAGEGTNVNFSVKFQVPLSSWVYIGTYQTEICTHLCVSDAVLGAHHSLIDGKYRSRGQPVDSLLSPATDHGLGPNQPPPRNRRGRPDTARRSARPARATPDTQQVYG